MLLSKQQLDFQRIHGSKGVTHPENNHLYQNIYSNIPAPEVDSLLFEVESLSEGSSLKGRR